MNIVTIHYPLTTPPAMSMFEDNRYRWRETYFVLFDAAEAAEAGHGGQDALGAEQAVPTDQPQRRQPGPDRFADA